MSTDLAMSPTTQSFASLTRNMSSTQIARIQSGKLKPEEADHPLVRQARQAWLNRQR